MELQQLRRDNSSLDAGAHEKEKSLTQLRTRLAVLEQELSDKEQVHMYMYCSLLLVLYTAALPISVNSLKNTCKAVHP